MNEINLIDVVTISIADPTGDGNGGESVWGVIEGQHKRFFEGEYLPKIRHTEPGLLSMVSLGDNLIGSQFFFTLGCDLTSLDGVHCVIGQAVEGLDVLRQLNEAICDNSKRPYQDIRITHTVVLEDPFENPRGFREPSRSPSPSAERLRGGRIAADEDIDETSGKTPKEIEEMLQDREAKARATILEIVGDLPDADVAPPENVLFVCKLNAVTTDDDLEIIFSRFGKVKGCEVIRDRVSGDSLQYAFVEFEDQKSCEAAYFKMDNVLIDDRRIHVDFSQSVAKVQWRGKGRGLIIKDGSKDNRINFSDYKNGTSNNRKGDNGSRDRRNDSRRDGGQDRYARRNSRSPQNGNRRRSPVARNYRDQRRSPMRYNERDDRFKQRDRRGSPRRNEQRPRYDDRNRSNRVERDQRQRSRSTQQNRRSISRDRNNGSHSNSRGNAGRRSPDRSRNRSRERFGQRSSEQQVDKVKSVRKPSVSASSSDGSDNHSKKKSIKKSKKSKKRRHDTSSDSDTGRKSKKSKKKKSKKSKKTKRRSTSTSSTSSTSSS